MNPEVIILAGGKGSRLKSVVSDVPKPMAPIQGEPFLKHLMTSLHQQGLNKFILSIGYMSELIQNYFDNKEFGFQVSYVIEELPLGTGGAIKKAVEKVNSEAVIVLNGDTFFDVDYEILIKYFETSGADVVIALRKVKDTDRYGTIEMDKNNNIRSFKEKTYISEGLINGGIYIMKKDLLDRFELQDRFSIETDFFEKKGSELVLKGILFDNYFIDIGIPEDYAKARKELPILLS